MNKKVIVLVSVAILILAALGGYLIVSSKNKKVTPGIVATQTTTNREAVAADLEYNDASGFSFMYPSSIKVEDVTPADDSYYSKLNLNKSGNKITITVKDDSSKTVDEFIASDDYYKGATLSGATSLGGLKGKQYVVGGKLITLALGDGVLYLIEGTKDGGYWEDSQNIVASTFALGLQTSSGSSASDDSNTTYEAEEVVE